MKLSHLYTNESATFAPIRFRKDINVILARIQHPKENEKTGHNLGKTLLIDVIDFCLLKDVGKKGHFLKTREDLFGQLVFFLELGLHSGGFVTVRRPVREATSIAFKRHADPHQDFTMLSDDKWDHVDVSLTASVKLLDSYLNLSSIKPWPYRTGVSYFMRRQADYGDEFRLSKFRGRDIDWKPYVARVLGFDDNLLKRKYEADAEHKRIESRRNELQAEVSVKVSDYEKLRASIAVKRDEVERKVSAIDQFDFHQQESTLTQELADQVEQEIAVTNELLYSCRFDLAQIERGLQDEIHFDLADVKRVFSEAQITFPDQLAHNYKELVEFNRRILMERRIHLLQRAEELRAQITRLEKSNATLSEKRRSILQILGGTDSLRKFKDLQRQLDTDRANLSLMEEKAAKLKAIRDLNDDLRRTKTQCDELTVAIEELVNDGSNRFNEILKTFSHIIKELLHRSAVLYVRQNDSGNLDFHAEFTDTDSESPTQERRGTSFQQILCIAFDLAVLTTYAHEPFFHFVYHDGGLERLESKRKLALLQIIRRTCNEYGIQYLLSTLDEDLPIAEDTIGLCPKVEEIVLELHDGGDDGRLFKVGRF
ncbi:MAG: DUF2326 domain-containing protein [Desulfurivibrionaceae bacterium]|nr:DUF2326 domain-containing protein [Desulfurivibrionaceae bacterium]